MSNSVASAACSQIVGTSGRSAAVKFSSTNVAGSLRPGGLPMPTRTRRKSLVPSADATELLIELGLEPAQNRVHAW